MNMESSDEEDIHQCGRCKAVFHDIHAYFEHKQEQCFKKKFKQVSLESSNTCEEKDSESKLSQNVTVQQPDEAEEKYDPEQMVTEQTLTPKTQSKTGNRKKSAKIKKSEDNQKINKQVDTSKRQVIDKGHDCLPYKNSPRLRDRKKITPKKRWAESYDNDADERNYDESEHAEGSSPGVRKRGRPVKAAKYSHMSKVVNPSLEQLSFKCHLCEYEANKKDEYDRHLRVKHKLSSYVCSQCLFPFRDKYKLKRHQRSKCCKTATETDVPMFAKFKSTSRIYKHLPLDGDLDIFDVGHRQNEQTDCLESSGANENENERDDPDLVSLQIGSEADSFEFNCYECEEAFSSYEDILKHVKDHGIIPGICRFCGKWFSNKYRLQRHITSSIHDHLTEADLGRVKDDLKELKLTWTASAPGKHRREKYRRYDCIKCKTTFPNRDAYLHHMKVHNTASIVQRHVCHWCPIVMNCSREKFKEHMVSVHHLEIDSCTCVVCCKTFIQRSHNIRHREALHTPRQQVPLEYLPEITNASEEGHTATAGLNNDLKGGSNDMTESEVKQFSELSETKIYSCIVCCHISDDVVSHANHMELHRVWLPDLEKGGPFPESLFKKQPLLQEATMVELYNRESPDGRPISPDNLSLSSNGETCDDSIELDKESAAAAESDLFNIHQNNVVSCLDELESKAAGIYPKDEPEKHSDEKTPIINQFAFLDELEKLGKLPNDESKFTVKEDVTTDKVDKPDKSPTLDKASLVTKSLDYSQESKWNCPYCDIVHNSLEDDYLHKVEYHKLRAVFRCINDECPYIFSDSMSYEMHSKTHGQRAFICNLCNEHCSSVNQLLGHKFFFHRRDSKMHKDGNKCRQCRKVFSTEKELQKHIESGENHFPCDECGKVYQTAGDLNAHVNSHANVKPFLCELCGAGFVNNMVLKRHRLIHKGDRPHKCPKCNDAFGKKEHLIRHINAKHTTDMPFKCDQCDKGFKRKDKLKDHMRIHSAERPYKCKQCGLTYRHREGLKYHEKAHERDKKFECSVCEVNFPRPGQLKKHLVQSHNIRTREQHLYPCGVCMSTFSRPERVKRHIESAHGGQAEWNIFCNICSKGFPGQRSLDHHMHSAHKEDTGTLNTSVEKKKRKVTKLMKQVNDNVHDEALEGPTLLESVLKAEDIQLEVPLAHVFGDTSSGTSDNHVLVIKPAGPIAPSTDVPPPSTVAHAIPNTQPTTVFMHLHPPVKPNVVPWPDAMQSADTASRSQPFSSDLSNAVTTQLPGPLSRPSLNITLPGSGQWTNQPTYDIVRSEDIAPIPLSSSTSESLPISHSSMIPSTESQYTLSQNSATSLAQINQTIMQFISLDNLSMNSQNTTALSSQIHQTNLGHPSGGFIPHVIPVLSSSSSLLNATATLDQANSGVLDPPIYALPVNLQSLSQTNDNILSNPQTPIYASFKTQNENTK